MNLKSYDCNKNLQLTKDINVSNLKCKGNGHIHNTYVNLEFIELVQNFIDKNDFEKIEIINGYLCNEYIKKFNKNDKYSKGNAIDICFYKDGEIIPSKEICKLAKKCGIVASEIDEKCVCIEDGYVAFEEPIVEEKKPKNENVEKVVEEIEEQTTFNEDTIDELLEDGVVENVSN